MVVADAGIGISPEFLPFVFDIFRQQERGTRRSHEGLGIGLSLVKRLVELQQGTVTVASAGEGQGTEVKVTFPLARQRPALDETRSAPATGEPAKSLAGLAVRVIEDSEDSRESLRVFLELCGARTSVAHDGCEALESIEKVAPDVVLCDLRMPGMDGYEFMRELHRRRPRASLPVIAMSGLASEDDRRRTQAAGFRAHISKPFSTTAMINAVADAVGVRRKPSSSGSNAKSQAR